MARKIEPPSPPFIPARWHGGRQVPRLIVMHGTVSPCVPGGARAVARDFATTNTKKSAHYTVDPGEEIQSVGDHTVAYHCGHNQDSIGVELCDPQAGPSSRWGDLPHHRMLDRAAHLVAQLCLAYAIPIRRLSVRDLLDGKHGICGHVDMSNAFHQSSHTDPGEAFPWVGFIAAVQRAADEILHTPAPAPEHGTRHVSANIQYVPKMRLDDAAEDLGTVTSHAGVVGWQEIGRDYRRLLRAVDGWATYWPGGRLFSRAANSIPISWRTRRFDKIASGRRRTHGGRPKVTPARFITWVLLENRKTGERHWRVNTHYVSKAWSTHPERRPLWETHDRKLAETVRMLLAEHGPNGVITGDFNRGIGSPRLNEMLSAQPRADRADRGHVHHGIDHLYVFGRATTSSFGHFGLHSDHDAVLLRVDFTKES